MKLKDLIDWNKLTDKEKKRLEKVYATRVEKDYDLGGKLAIGENEKEKK